MTRTRQIPLMAAAILLQSLLLAGATSGPVAAQTVAPFASPAPAADADAAPAPRTERRIQALIAAQTEVAARLAGLPDTQEEMDDRTRADLDRTVRRFGLKDFADYEDTGTSVIAVLDGIDPATRLYVGKEVLLKQELEEIRADKSLRPDERKAALKEVTAQLAQVEPVLYPENIRLVVAQYDRLVALFPNDP